MSLNELTGSAVGRRCLDLVHSVGSVISLKLEGAVGLLVLCAWRAQRATEVLATSQGSAEQLEALRQAVLGQVVSRVTVVNELGDLVIGLDGDLTFTIFCDQPDGHDNYSMDIANDDFAWTTGRGLTAD